MKTLIHIATRVAVLALSLGVLLGVAHGSDVLDHSNSASATESPFTQEMRVTAVGPGSSPADDSNSASAWGAPFATDTQVTVSGPGASPSDDSGSASAQGGFGTGSRTARADAKLAKG